MKKLIGAIAFLMAGCAATYTPPIQKETAITIPIQGNKADLIGKVKRVLVTEGYQITSSDDASGIVSTAAKNIHLTPEQANCGRTLGIDYLLDNRTSSTVSMGAVVVDNSVTLKATMSATYLPGHVTQGITLTCVSTGKLEQQLLTAIRHAN
jgi:hypothetical protein